RYHALAIGEATPVGATIDDAERVLDPTFDTGVDAQRLTATCARCHGPTGNGRGAGLLPKIAGQKPEYLFNALTAYAEGKRPSGSMAPAAAVLTEQERRTLAEHYAKLPVEPLASPLEDDAAVARGALLAAHGVAARGIPPCMECHGPASHSHSPAYPSLAGQHFAYLRLQL